MAWTLVAVVVSNFDIRPICRRPHDAALRTPPAPCASFVPRADWLNMPHANPAGASPAMADPDRIIRLRTVLDRTGLSRSTLYRKIAEGTFPAQLRISIHGAGWRESDIDRWVSEPEGWRRSGEQR
jgi:prophage regulatory protein